MNPRLSLVLLLGGALLCGLALFTHQLSPDLARTTLWGGLIGGGLCAGWGAAGRFGYGSRALPLLTLAAASFVILSQAVTFWMQLGVSASAFVVSVMFVLSTGMTGLLAHAGSDTTAPEDAPRPATAGTEPGPEGARQSKAIGR